LGYFASIGGFTKVYADIEADPALLFGAGGTWHPLLLTGRTWHPLLLTGRTWHPLLLTGRSMLPIRLKRKWLAPAVATAAVELKPGGKAIAVTEANKAEYLQLFVAHRLVGEVQSQVDAFRAGLAVFFTDEVLAAVHVLRFWRRAAAALRCVCDRRGGLEAVGRVRGWAHRRNAVGPVVLARGPGSRCRQPSCSTFARDLLEGR
jgi:hypothetical protein